MINLLKIKIYYVLKYFNIHPLQIRTFYIITGPLSHLIKLSVGGIFKFPQLSSKCLKWNQIKNYASYSHVTIFVVF